MTTTGASHDPRVSSVEPFHAPGHMTRISPSMMIKYDTGHHSVPPSLSTAPFASPTVTAPTSLHQNLPGRFLPHERERFFAEAGSPPGEAELLRNRSVKAVAVCLDLADPEALGEDQTPEGRGIHGFIRATDREGRARSTPLPPAGAHESVRRQSSHHHPPIPRRGKRQLTVGEKAGGATSGSVPHPRGEGFALHNEFHGDSQNPRLSLPTFLSHPQVSERRNRAALTYPEWNTRSKPHSEAVPDTPAIRPISPSAKGIKGAHSASISVTDLSQGTMITASATTANPLQEGP